MIRKERKWTIYAHVLQIDETISEKNLNGNCKQYVLKFTSHKIHDLSLSVIHIDRYSVTTQINVCQVTSDEGLMTCAQFTDELRVE